MAKEKKPILDVTEEHLTQIIPESWLGGKSVDRDTAFEMAYDIREYIRERVSKGRGLGNKTFDPNVYSKSYQNSKEFKAYGKKPTPVNMKLTGDMLGSVRIDVVDGLPMVTLDDPEVAPRGHGHQTGQYGKGPLPVREWFGVTRDEFEKKILPKFKDRLKEKDEIVTVQKIKYDTAVDEVRKAIRELQGVTRIVKLIKK